MSITQQHNILALETCTMACSVALWHGGVVIEKIIEGQRSHSKEILPMCQAVLAEAGLSMTDIDAIACTRGPGAFTGLRIGVGVAKGLAFGQDIPVYAVSSLQALATRVYAQTGEQHIMALLDARMGELYVGEYRIVEGQAVLQGSEILTDVEHLSNGGQLFVGTGVDAYREQLIEKGIRCGDVPYPTASDVITVVNKGQAEQTTAAELTPLYLRDKVTY